MATNKEIILNAYASFAAGDVPAALGAMADDIQWSEAEDSHSLARTPVLRRYSTGCSWTRGNRRRLRRGARAVHRQR